MIEYNDVMPLLLKACPTFEPQWAKLVEYWDDEPPPLYVGLAALAGHLVALFKQGQTDEFSAVFELTERIIVDGSEEARTAAEVGLLESLQSGAFRAGLDPDHCFTSFLGPESRQGWDALNEFWNPEKKPATSEFELYEKHYLLSREGIEYAPINSEQRQTLLNQLEDSDHRVRYRAAEALGNSGDPGVIDPLLKVLGKFDPRDAESKVNFSASYALAVIGEPVVRP